MENGRDVKELIKGIAGYVLTAALFVALIILSYKADAYFFKSLLPVKPVETAIEVLFTVTVYSYVSKHAGKTDRKRLMRYIPIALIPLVFALAAFFYVPGKSMTVNENAATWLFLVFVPVSEDLVLCALGCTLLLHKNNMKSSGVVIMLICMALREAALSEASVKITLLSVLASVMIGYFEIYLHMRTHNALFCAFFHFLLHVFIRAPRLYSDKSSPFFGDDASVIIGIVFLSVTFVLGFYLREKLKNKEIYMDTYD